MNPIYKGQYPPKSKEVLWVKGNKIYAYTADGWQETSADIIVDDSIMLDSENPVQSNVIQGAISEMKNQKLEELANKQNTLTFDSALSESSTNPIKNSAVSKQYINEDDVIDILNIIDSDYKKKQLMKTPLTMKVLTGGTIGWRIYPNSSGIAKTIEYKKNDGEWTSLTPTFSGVTFSVTEGDKIQFRGNNANYGTNQNNSSRFTSTANVDVYGNIMSLISSSNFENLTTFSSANNVFPYLFSGVKVVNAKDLYLPALSLTENCYASMFRNISTLVSGPNILATTGGRYSANSMFQNSTALTQAPVIKLTTLGYYTCRDMFRDCTSLVIGPTLPAETIDENSATMAYASMFSGCTSLNQITVMLMANTSHPNYYLAYMFEGVPSTGTLYKNPNLTNWPNSASNLPDTWTIVDAT